MSKIIKVKITEVVQTLRTRVVDLEVPEFSSLTQARGKTFDLDDGKGETRGTLYAITNFVVKQHSHEGDMTEEVIKAEIL